MNSKRPNVEKAGDRTATLEFFACICHCRLGLQNGAGAMFFLPFTSYGKEEGQSGSALVS